MRILKLYHTKYRLLTNSLKIPKGSSEAVNRRTYDTITTRKGTKRHTPIYNTLHRKLKI